MTRRSAATAAFATLAFGLPARPEGGPVALLAGPQDAEVLIEADTANYAWEARVLRLEGHVVARRGEGVVRAARGTLDRANGFLTLEGGVLGFQGKQVFLADSALIDLNTKTADLLGNKPVTTTTRSTKTGPAGVVETTTTVTNWYLQNTTGGPAGLAVLYLKERPVNPDAPLSGKNSLILHGSHVKQLSRGVYQAEEVTITPCDCALEPDYELFAHGATIDEDRAHLSGVRLHFLGATLPLFPLALPLTSRQWGLLAPQWGFNGVTGFSYAQPVFVPLGDSYDLTVTPGWFTGGSNPSNSAALGAGGRTVRGPQLGLEFRYAPVEGTRGSVSFDLFDDLDRRDSLGLPAPANDTPTSPGRGFRGVRGVAHLLHRSEGEAGVLALQGTVATDQMALIDVEPGTLERLQDSLHTDLGAWRDRGPLTVGADATFLQDMRIVNGGQPDRRLFGAERRTTFQRMPSLFAQVAPVPLGQAVDFSMEASAAQFAPFVPPDAQERSTGFAPSDLGAPGAALNAGDVARGPALRLDATPRMFWDGPATFPLDLRLDAGARADAWVVEGYPDRDRTRAYAMTGAHASLPLERQFGSTLHRIEPALDLRALTRPLQSGGPPIGDPADEGGAVYASSALLAQQGLGPGLLLRGVPTSHPCTAADPLCTIGVPSERRSYDEIDSAAPSTGAVEAVLSLSQTLWTKPGPVPVRLVRLDLLQDAVLWAYGERARLGEAIAQASFALGPASAGGAIHYDWADRAISFVSGEAHLRDTRTDEAHASLLLLRPSSSERLRQGIDELFSAVRLATSAGDLTGGAGVGFSALLPLNFRLAYDFSRSLTPSTQLPAGLPDTTHSAALTYETVCHCAGLLFGVALPMRDGKLLSGPIIRVVIDLKQLGSFATL